MSKVQCLIIVVLIAIISAGVAWTVAPSEKTIIKEVKSEQKNNDWVIAETKKCEKAGMEAQVIQNIFTYNISKINCVPKN